jgi:4-alpha-glucanotransferase
VLLPVTSLPSKYGIGCFSKEAYEFIDFLKDAGQSYWQILPLGQTGYGDSPYQAFSTFAGNPYFIDPEQLLKAGYITRKDLGTGRSAGDPMYVDYGAIYRYRFRMLRKAYENSPYALQPSGKWTDPKYGEERVSFDAFRAKAKAWLPDYALFEAVKAHFGGRSFLEWDVDIRRRKPEALKKYQELLADEVRFYEFQQYMFDCEWHALKKYANAKGISIIGDIPIYVAMDSSDTWSHPELFKLDESGKPTVVAGCPPDGFSATGQLWGNPIYNWEYHRKTGFEWWIARIRNCFELYDIVRIDHFRGFDEYYEIPAGDTTAVRGQWTQGPGFALFEALNAALGKKPIIAEDLGFLTPSVIRLVKKTGYPGMKVLQFAFDSREESDYLPHNYQHNCVVYTGTHDNETMRGWFRNVNRHDRAFAKRYAGIGSEKTAVYGFIRCALESVADTAIIPIQDYLDLGDEARINHPSTLGGLNWRWRLQPGQLTAELAKKMKRMAADYGRQA